MVPAPVARITTEGSVWLIDDAAYTRLPRDEGGARQAETARLADGERHPHRGVWWLLELGTGLWRLRVLPVAGHGDDYGLISGVVLHAAGLGPTDPGGLGGVPTSS